MLQVLSLHKVALTEMVMVLWMVLTQTVMVTSMNILNMVMTF